jgi:cyanophycinase-like exopeptidase
MGFSDCQDCTIAGRIPGVVCGHPCGKYAWQKEIQRCFYCSPDEPPEFAPIVKCPPPLPPSSSLCINAWIPLTLPPSRSLCINATGAALMSQVDQAGGGGELSQTFCTTSTKISTNYHHPQQKKLQAPCGGSMKKILLLCDGLCDLVQPTLTDVVAGHGLIPPNPKILVFVQGYVKTKSQLTWGAGAINVMSTVFGVGEDTVKILDVDSAMTSYDGHQRAMRLLGACNVFHMAGGTTGDLAHLWSSVPDLAQKLRDRTECGEIFYIGSSAGSVIAGSSLVYNLERCTKCRPFSDPREHYALSLVNLNISVYHNNNEPVETSQLTARDPLALRLGNHTGILLLGTDSDTVTPICLKKVSASAMRAIRIDSAKLQRPIPPQVQVTIPELPILSGVHTWEDATGKHTYHLQFNLMQLDAPPLVLFWLPGCGSPHDPKWNALAKLLGRVGPVADLVHNNCILVSPMDDTRLGKDQYRVELPAWITNLFSVVSQRSNGNVAIAGFSRGAKWASELAVNRDNPQWCRRALLLAPYCRKAWTDDECQRFAFDVAAGFTEVRSLYSMKDSCCPWPKVQTFVEKAGRSRDVTEVAPSHDDILHAFCADKFSDDSSWLLGF